MEELFYNRHYINVDSSDRIVDGFSDAFRAPDVDSVCINEQGGYQFRLFPGGEENPALFDRASGVPLYKWDGEVVPRSAEEIAADTPEHPGGQTTEERLTAVEETTAQQGEILSILLSGETEAGV